jgi:hypothetical protein
MDFGCKALSQSEKQSVEKDRLTKSLSTLSIVGQAPTCSDKSKLSCRQGSRKSLVKLSCNRDLEL